MAYFAELDENNVVLRVVVISNQDCLDENGNEIESVGINRCLELFKTGTWKQTSFNTIAGVHSEGKQQFRKNFAGIGYVYNAQLDAFVPPKPEESDSWILDETQCIWRNPELEEAQAATMIGVTRV